MPVPPKPDRDWSSDRTYEAAGLFVTLLGSIERGKFDQASRLQGRLSAMGYAITFRPARPGRPGRRGVTR